MQLQTQTRPKVLSVLVLEDRIDAATAIQFKEKMRDLTKNGAIRAWCLTWRGSSSSIPAGLVPSSR